VLWRLDPLWRVAKKYPLEFCSRPSLASHSVCGFDGWIVRGHSSRTSLPLLETYPIRQAVFLIPLFFSRFGILPITFDPELNIGHRALLGSRSQNQPPFPVVHFLGAKFLNPIYVCHGRSSCSSKSHFKAKDERKSCTGLPLFKFKAF